jgi:hypothetical protein
MKATIILTAVFLFSFGYGGCQQKNGNSNKVKMTQTKNPYYSNTDTNK